MAVDVRTKIHETVDQLSEDKLADVLYLIGLVDKLRDKNAELEDILLLATGKLKALNDEIETDSHPIEDWRSWLRDL